MKSLLALMSEEACGSPFQNYRPQAIRLILCANLEQRQACNISGVPLRLILSRSLAQLKHLGPSEQGGHVAMPLSL